MTDRDKSDADTEATNSGSTDSGASGLEASAQGASAYETAGEATPVHAESGAPVDPGTADDSPPANGREEFAEEPVEDTPPTAAPAVKRKRRAAARDDSPPVPIDDDLIEPAGADLVAKNKRAQAGDPAGMAWPDDAADDDAPVKVYKPKRNAIIALAVLSAIMLALSGLGFSQDGATIQKSYSPAQMQVLVSSLEKDKVRSFSDAETKSLAAAWTDQGLRLDPTPEQLSTLITSKYPDKPVTAKQVSDTLEKNKVTLKLPTVESLDSSIRTQSLIFLAVGLAGLVSAFFYFRGAKWARLVGMVVSGLVVVMWLMQVLNGALSLPVIVVLLAGAVSFFLLLRGRLTPPRGGAAPAGPGGFGGLGALFRPRPRP